MREIFYFLFFKALEYFFEKDIEGIDLQNVGYK